MNRFLIILFLCYVPFCSSFGQKLKPLPPIKEIAGNNKHPLQDSGIEKKLTDEETRKIIDYIITPEFKRGNFFEGTKNGLSALMQKFR